MRSKFLGQKREARVAKTIAGGRGAGLCSWTGCRFRLDADVRVCGDPEGTPTWYYIIGIIVKGPHVPSSGTLSSRHLCEWHLPLTDRGPDRWACPVGHQMERWYALSGLWIQLPDLLESPSLSQ